MSTQVFAGVIPVFAQSLRAAGTNENNKAVTPRKRSDREFNQTQETKLFRDFEGFVGLRFNILEVRVLHKSF